MDKRISVMNDLHKINISTVIKPDVPSESTLVQGIPSAAPQQPAISRQLSEAIRRRISDFRLSRRDLAVRTEESLVWIDHEIAESERKLKELKPRRDHLVFIASELKKESPLDVDGSATQSQVAAETRHLEELRLDACRIIAESGIGSPGAQAPAQSGSSLDGIDWGSVTFGQLCRVGWGMFFPVVLSVLIGSLLIGASVIVAFNWRIQW